MFVDYIFHGIKVLQKAGKLGKVFEVEYRGRGLSLNQFYVQGHWRNRSNVKNKYKGFFEKILEKSDLQELDRFFLVMTYNSLHDVDNVVGTEKVFVDTLKKDKETGEGYIKDDNKKYFRGMAIFPDFRLKKDTFKFFLIEDYDS